MHNSKQNVKFALLRKLILNQVEVGKTFFFRFSFTFFHSFGTTVVLVSFVHSRLCQEVRKKKRCREKSCDKKFKQTTKMLSIKRANPRPNRLRKNTKKKKKKQKKSKEKLIQKKKKKLSSTSKEKKQSSTSFSGLSSQWRNQISESVLLLLNSHLLSLFSSKLQIRCTGSSNSWNRMLKKFQPPK